MRRALATLAVVASVVASGRSAFAQGAPVTSDRARDDGRVHVDGYAGMEFLTVTRDFEDFSVRGLSRQPYVLRVADVRVSGLGPLDARINAAVTSLLAAGGFGKDEPRTKADLGEAERYAAILGWALGKSITLRGEARYARMVTVAAPNFRSAADFDRTTWYVPETGAPIRMHPGDSVASETTWYSLAVRADVDGKAFGVDWLENSSFAYRFTRLTTPSAYGLSHGDSTASAELLALVDDTLACHALTTSQIAHKELFGDLSLDGELHLGFGYARVTSALVGASGGICGNYGGTLALKYSQPSWSLLLGYHFDQLTAIVSDSDLALGQTLLYSENQRLGRVRVAPAGSRWNAPRAGYKLQMLAPFARLVVSF